jgi:hypothetical protein
MGDLAEGASCCMIQHTIQMGNSTDASRQDQRLNQGQDHLLIDLGQLAGQSCGGRAVL